MRSLFLFLLALILNTSLEARTKPMSQEQIKQAKADKISEANDTAKRIVALLKIYPRGTSIGDTLTEHFLQVSDSNLDFERSALPAELQDGGFGGRRSMNKEEDMLNLKITEAVSLMDSIDLKARETEYAYLQQEIDSIETEEWIKTGLKTQLQNKLQTIMLLTPKNLDDVRKYDEALAAVKKSIRSQREAAYSTKKREISSKDSSSSH